MNGKLTVDEWFSGKFTFAKRKENISMGYRY